MAHLFHYFSPRWLEPHPIDDEYARIWRRCQELSKLFKLVPSLASPVCQNHLQVTQKMQAIFQTAVVLLAKLSGQARIIARKVELDGNQNRPIHHLDLANY